MAQAQKCRVVFMGTPDFALPSLRLLMQWQRGSVVGVYTQPDRPAGRGNKVNMSVVKQAALQAGLPVFQPANFQSEKEVDILRSLRADFLVVAAYGLLLPAAVLALPAIDCINVHASLLPAYRGAAPIQRAVMDSWQAESRTGVSIMRVVRQLDAGPVYASASLAIGEHTAGSLRDALSDLGASLLIRVLDDILDGSAMPVEQDNAKASYAPKIFREDGVVDWNMAAARIHARIRGVTPRPGAGIVLEPASDLAPLSGILLPGSIGEPVEQAVPGTLWRQGRTLSIACADFWYRLSSLRPAGKKTMTVVELLNGALRNTPQGFCGRVRSLS
ncbi:MAG: methionyl-tRNA formyltransferase [Desulfovibrio sp.]|nr:methionyl-tRNA formyltransferase [Desulfovibrio sp.]